MGQVSNRIFEIRKLPKLWITINLIITGVFLYSVITLSLPFRLPVISWNRLKPLEENVKESADDIDLELESSWVFLFPHIEHMIGQIQARKLPLEFTESTSAKHTTIDVIEANFEVGQILRASIQANDFHGNRKEYGGDFMSVILRRPGSNNDGISCEILDLLTGSYEVKCILAWPGAAELQAKLIHPSEGIYELIQTYNSSREYGIVRNVTFLNSMKEIEYSECSIGFPNLQ